MINQPTLPSAIKKANDLVLGVKSPQLVSSSNAAFYEDTRTGGPVSVNLTLNAGATRRFLIEYSHPETEYPYAVPQFEFENIGNTINYDLLRYTNNLSIATKSSWVLSVTNIGAVADNFDIFFGVVSNAPGTVSVSNI